MKLFITLYIHFDLGRLLVLFFPGDQQLLKYLLEVPALQVYLEVPVVQIVLSPPLVLVSRNSQVVLVARTALAVLEDHVLLLNLPDLEVLEDQVLLELRDGPIKMNNIRRIMLEIIFEVLKMCLNYEVFQFFNNLRFLQECLESLACLEHLVVLIYRVGLFPHDHLLAQPAPTD